MKEYSQQLKRDIETLATLQGVTVLEAVEGVKAQMMAEGAEMEVVAEFFGEMDEIARLHTN